MKNFEFEKFIDDFIERDEKKSQRLKKYAEMHGDEHPGRIYNKLYRERWQNRIKWQQK